jgi:hypothetical protein
MVQSTTYTQFVHHIATKQFLTCLSTKPPRSALTSPPGKCSKNSTSVYIGNKKSIPPKNEKTVHAGALDDELWTFHNHRHRKHDQVKAHTINAAPSKLICATATSAHLAHCPIADLPISFSKRVRNLQTSTCFHSCPQRFTAPNLANTGKRSMVNRAVQDTGETLETIQI